MTLRTFQITLKQEVALMPRVELRHIKMGQEMAGIPDRTLYDLVKARLHATSVFTKGV